MTEQLQPRLRFKGFTDAWTKRKLGEVAEIVGGGTPSTTVSEYWDGSIDWYTPAEIGDRIFLAGSRRKITEKGLENSSAKILPAGTVLFTSRAGIGNTAIINSEATTNQGFQSIVPHANLDTYFIFSRTYALKRYGETVGAGSTFVEVSGKQMARMPMLLPATLTEQSRIGDFFRLLDALIAANQRKADLLQKLKRGYLQKLFSGAGDTIPRLRFVGFADAWEQRKLGKVAKIIMGQSPNSTNYTDNPNDWILVQGNADMKDGRVCPRVWTTQVTKKAERGDLILSVRAPVGDVGKTDFNVVLGRGVAAIKGNEFLYQTLTKMKKERHWDKLSTGSTFDSISSEDIRESSVMTPCKEEQASIGNFFAILDFLITCQQRKREQLEKLKQAYLQKMFV